MTISIAKAAWKSDETTTHAALWEQEPTPEPTPGQKAGVYSQKAPGFPQKAQGYEQKAPGFPQKAPGFGQKAPGYEQDSVVVFYLLPRKPNSLLILVNILKN